MSLEEISAHEQSWTETPPKNPLLRHLIGQVVERQTWLDKLAGPLQGLLLQWSGQPGEPRRKIKDFLNGTWLGHGLHPVLTDVPLGAWSSTMLLDVIELRQPDKGVVQDSDLLLGLGILGAAGAAVTGFADWSDLDGTDRRVGIMHGLLNGGALLTNIVSLILRLNGRRRAGVFLSTTSYAMTLFSAYLGGELVFAKGIGVNHTAWEGGSDDFVPVLDEQELLEGKMTRVDAAGIPAVLLKQGNSIFAIGATCSHLAGPLDEGTCQDGIVTCPWHGSRFRMSDGGVVTGPAAYAAPTFAVRVRQGKVELRRMDHA